ncbi:uncharacterized protein P174DRAFT_419129 [Aspergillus novofumigatus IBT 16806]|uniref:Uncharacterized protein n=1 Tax=Aspergillus novofumigatus (strain IBT 16806) TaxID=1392255 RepID=A0A2I1CC16_ASPN1|nr:uncharacterized protein P174DRAFT_419129 [Aspergillus novofumigatus IBT 16806]PKX95173.1 hypothetical protein P174DRAFT_419129 [Aspergillus novofumigatus IBT 16806]
MKIKKFFSTQTGRVLEFFWRKGTANVEGINPALAENAIETEFLKVKDAFPELRQAAKAEVKQKPHRANKADGREDPFHANFVITSQEGLRITSAHYYPTPIGGSHVWFSKAKYNGGKKVMDYLPKAGESGKASGGEAEEA